MTDRTQQALVRLRVLGVPTMRESGATVMALLDCAEALAARTWRPRKVGEACPQCKCRAFLDDGEISWQHEIVCQTAGGAALARLADVVLGDGDAAP